MKVQKFSERVGEIAESPVLANTAMAIAMDQQNFPSDKSLMDFLKTISMTNNQFVALDDMIAELEVAHLNYGIAIGLVLAGMTASEVAEIAPSDIIWTDVLKADKDVLPYPLDKSGVAEIVGEMEWK